jgi:hypothetical protein
MRGRVKEPSPDAPSPGALYGKMEKGGATTVQIRQNAIQQIRIIKRRIQQIDPPPQGRRISI